MGTRLFVLGIHTLSIVLPLLLMTWLFQGGSQEHILVPGYVVSALYWAYTSIRILAGKDLMARKAEDWLNSRK
jgi:hypothetical protein